MASIENYRDEIDRLKILEASSSTDVLVRMIGIPVGAILHHLYTGEAIAFVWCTLYIALYMICRRYLLSFGPEVTGLQQFSVHGMIALLTVAYLWLPTWMLLSPDRNLALAGAALVMSQLVHLVHRGDTSLHLIRGLTLAVFGTMFGLLIFILPQITHPVALVGILLSWTALIFYLAQSLMAARRRILAENEAKSQSYQAQKLAALGQLAGGIAHDFNNILTAISGNLELYKHLPSQEEKDAAIASAEEASARAASIVRQILVYARKSPVEAKRVDANAPVESIQGLADHLVPSSIELTIKPLEFPQPVLIDSDQFVTALMNLVLNAVDAIPNSGHISLTVSLRHVSKRLRVLGGRKIEKGGYVVYKISDTGSGIPDDLLDRVADPFFTTKPVGKGTGLGLSMVASIAEEAGGGLEITSSPGGTSVSIFVPVSG
ncbi:MAG: ATP-binding protein [Pseudomonadota bacterium]